jgi:phage tail protein X
MATETLPPVANPFTTLDQLLYRRFGRETPGQVEATYALNPGLAGKGPFLPVGTRVVVELPEPTASARPVRVLRLTD